jgi:phenylacetate-CoA ligase
VNLYPSAVDDLVRGVPGVLEYEVELRRRAGMADLAIKVEADAFDRVAASLVEAFRLRHSLRVTVERAERGSLPRYEFKARRYKRVDLE